MFECRLLSIIFVAFMKKNTEMNSDIDQMHYLVLHIGEAHCRANWNFKDISSPFTRMYYVTEGHARIILPDKTQDLRPGFMYIVPAFTPHSYVCREEFRHYYIHIYNEAGHDILEDWDLPTEILPDSGILARIRKLHELCPEMELTQTDPHYYDNNSILDRNIQKNKRRELYARVESRGIIYQLLAQFLHGAHPKQYVEDERITRMLEHIRANLEGRTDLDSLAAFSCLSKDHLIRIFKREMNMTPLAYVNRKKIEKAQLRLVTETASVKEIAYQLGFEDQTYFNRMFKKITGTTPTGYREASRKPAL